MTWPTTFNNLAGGNEPASLIDEMFNQTAAMIDIPSLASGINAISLTPLVNCPVLSGYTEFCAARFRAAGNSSGAVTAQFNGLGFLPVYNADGVTQVSTGGLATGFEYVVRFSQALNGGAGGWFLEAPSSFSSAGVNGALSSTPGGRLTFVSATPVMTSTQAAPQNIYYAPYYHPFVPIYNGSTIQMYQFTASQSDQVGLTLAMGGSASWPANTVFDVFVTLVAGVPTLCTVAWTNPLTRATNLAVFGGFPTNATPATARTGVATTISLAANQGTFLGSLVTSIDGQSTWTYGSTASGGGLANFRLCNYYNKVQVNTIVADNGASYTYTSATVRSARASANNAIYYVQSDSERVATFFCNTVVVGAATGAIGYSGIGVNANAFNILNNLNAYSVGTGNPINTQYSLTSTGFTSVFALEAGDGTNANSFNITSSATLIGSIWL